MRSSTGAWSFPEDDTHQTRPTGTADDLGTGHPIDELGHVTFDAWGNYLAVVITDGTTDQANEFDLYLFQERDKVFSEIEAGMFLNLSMDPGALRFVETVLANSKYVRAKVNPDNLNTDFGRSISRDPPQDLKGLGRTKMRIYVDGDGPHEVDLSVALAKLEDLKDLSSPTNIATAIQYVVRNEVTPNRGTTGPVFANFTCKARIDGKLELISGTQSASSSVEVIPASDEKEDASIALTLGKLAGGVETLGGAVTRPMNTPTGRYYFVGDDAATTPEVDSARLGTDSKPVTADGPYVAAFRALDEIQDVSLIAVPGIGSPTVVGAGMNYCTTFRPLADCFFIGDMSEDDMHPDEEEDLLEAVTQFVNSVDSRNSHGAVYGPWVRMPDPVNSSGWILVPPSGYVAGIYARTDARRGVWKAPAGTAASLSGAIGLALELTDEKHGVLNDNNVNVIRRFDASGIVLWGARTIHENSEWKYIPVRRMANMIKVSIYNGIQWAVFEPNDEPLWAQLRLNVGTFMNNLFRQGAFQGATPSDAYFVRCDGETTTQADIDLGRVNLQVGFAPLKPAEFVVVTISQKAGQG